MIGKYQRTTGGINSRLTVTTLVVVLVLISAFDTSAAPPPPPSTKRSTFPKPWPNYEYVYSTELMDNEADDVKTVNERVPQMAIKLLTMLMEMQEEMDKSREDKFRVRQQAIPPKRTHGKCGPFKICGPLRLRYIQ